jgi:hypothetical protein
MKKTCSFGLIVFKDKDGMREVRLKPKSMSPQKQQTDDGMMHATLENTPILEHPLNIGKPIQLIVYLLHVSAASQTYGWKQLDRYPDCEASRNMA